MQKEELLVILCELYKECMTIKQVFFPPIFYFYFFFQVLYSCLVFSYSLRIVQGVHDMKQVLIFFSPSFFAYFFSSQCIHTTRVSKIVCSYFLFSLLFPFFSGVRPKYDGFLQGSKKVQKIVGRQKRQERQGKKRKKRKGKYFGADN